MGAGWEERVGLVGLSIDFFRNDSTSTLWESVT